jgi:hypothetical protein
MRRHRHAQIGLGDQLGAGAVQPGAEGRDEMQPMAVLDGSDELAAGLV